MVMLASLDYGKPMNPIEAIWGFILVCTFCYYSAKVFYWMVTDRWNDF